MGKFGFGWAKIFIRECVGFGIKSFLALIFIKVTSRMVNNLKIFYYLESIIFFLAVFYFLCILQFFSHYMNPRRDFLLHQDLESILRGAPRIGIRVQSGFFHVLSNSRKDTAYES